MTSDSTAPAPNSGADYWRRYYNAAAGRGPSETLTAALAHLPTLSATPQAVDFGCGDGRDTAALLARGFSVLAIDIQAEAIRRLLARDDLPPPAEAAARLRTHIGGFEAVALPQSALVNASVALPYCAQEAFATVWQRIIDCLHPGGLFAGQLFGPNDSWAGSGAILSHRRDAVEALLRPYEMLKFTERDEAGATAQGEPKHWHIFNIVARKR